MNLQFYVKVPSFTSITRFHLLLQGPFVMVDELLKMIAECHLQKPQTTSKIIYL